LWRWGILLNPAQEKLQTVKFILYFCWKYRQMQNFSIQLPPFSAVSEFDAKIILAGELYQREKLSLGQAAELAGLSKRAFIEIMGKYGFSIFSQSIDDFRNDLQNAWKP
jgi:predicted HTH domain antitoxin